jgi:hypothetical protein
MGIDMKSDRVDFFGKEIHENDYIIIPREGYRELQLAKVIGWTKHKIRISYVQRKSWEGETTLLDINPEKYCKVDPKDITMRILKGEA